MHRRVLVVGAGGREHALAWALARDPGVERVVVAPGNPGMGDVAVVRPVATSDVAGLVALARAERAELAVVGPEAPLVGGIADALRANGIPTVGPGAGAARLEGSKSMCREVARAAGVPMAQGGTFEDPDAAMAEARARHGRVVVKADGLAAGKGVTVCEDIPAAEAAIRAAMVEGAFGDAGRTVVLEEVLVGLEASVIALCDERAVLALPAARDHKRLLDGDRGPNTGGMGAVSPVDRPDDGQVEAILDLVHRPILAELARRGIPFRGVLFAGLMLTADGPRLLECNVRLGDPETQATLPGSPSRWHPCWTGWRTAGSPRWPGTSGSGAACCRSSPTRRPRSWWRARAIRRRSGRATASMGTTTPAPRACSRSAPGWVARSIAP
ncbi:MAG: phosphoribosylamine--glycine ligase [Chloroflexota bacterium]